MSIYQEYKEIIEKETDNNNLAGIVYNITEEENLSPSQIQKLIDFACSKITIVKLEPMKGVS